jgi:hypothetical protein
MTLAYAIRAVLVPAETRIRPSLSSRSRDDQQERRLDDIDPRDHEGDHEEERMADEPAGRRGDRGNGEERKADAADHHRHVAIRRITAAERGDRAAKEGDRDDR